MKDKIICTTLAELQNQFAACGLKASGMNLCIRAYSHMSASMMVNFRNVFSVKWCTHLQEIKLSADVCLQ
jgi:hypothetical protein